MVINPALPCIREVKIRPAMSYARDSFSSENSAKTCLLVALTGLKDGHGSMPMARIFSTFSTRILYCSSGNSCELFFNSILDVQDLLRKAQCVCGGLIILIFL